MLEKILSQRILVEDKQSCRSINCHGDYYALIYITFPYNIITLLLGLRYKISQDMILEKVKEENGFTLTMPQLWTTC